MTIARDFASKAAIAFVAVAMIFSMFAPAARAQSSEELQAMINTLLAQIAALQGQVGQGGTSVASGICPYTWTRDLNVGASGADVMKLQQFLNANADTRVAASGAGSVGAETEFYGPATAAAVSKFQVMYRAEILTPAGLVNPTGYFGPSTRNKANSLCVSAPVEPVDPVDPTEPGTGPADLQGEASLETFEIDDAVDTDVSEGDTDAEIAIITVGFSDGDAEISRLDLAFTDSEGTDSDAWDTFDTISLWVDGDMVAEVDASSKRDYVGDEDDGILRFSNLGIVAMEDEEVEITVAATLQDNLDSENLGEWDVDADSMRFFDADGVATTEDGAPVTDDTATFNIETAGEGDQLDLVTDSANPKSTTLQLDSNNEKEYAIFSFKLDADDSDGDIVLDNLISVDVEISSSTGAINDLVRDFRIEVDGDNYDAESYVGTGDTATIDFDIDGDTVIDAGDSVIVTVYAKFKKMPDASAYQGTTILASLDTDQVDAESDESGDSIVVGGSDRDGNEHTLRSNGLALDLVSITETKLTKSVSNTDLDYGRFVYKFDVTAFGEDFYIDEDSDVINLSLFVDSVASTTGYTATVDISGAEDASNADFIIAEGETVTFTVTVESNTGHTGEMTVVLDSVDYSAGDDTTEELNVLATPVKTWTSKPLIIN